MNTQDKTALPRLVATLVAALGLLLLGPGCVAMNNGNSSIPKRTQELAVEQGDEDKDAINKNVRTRPHILPDGSIQLGPDGKPVMVAETETAIKSPAQQRHETLNHGINALVEENKDNRKAEAAAAKPGFWAQVFTPSNGYYNQSGYWVVSNGSGYDRGNNGGGYNGSGGSNGLGNGPAQGSVGGYTTHARGANYTLGNGPAQGGVGGVAYGGVNSPGLGNGPNQGQSGGFTVNTGNPSPGLGNGPTQGQAGGFTLNTGTPSPGLGNGPAQGRAGGYTLNTGNPSAGLGNGPPQGRVGGTTIH